MMNKFRNKKKMLSISWCSMHRRLSFFFHLGERLIFCIFGVSNMFHQVLNRFPSSSKWFPKRSSSVPNGFSSSPHVSFKVFMCSPRCSHSTTFYVLICRHVHFMSFEVSCHFGIWQICQVDFRSLYIAKLPSPLHPMEP